MPTSDAPQRNLLSGLPADLAARLFAKARPVRLAAGRCSDFSRMACLLVSIDGFLTVRIPRAHRAVRPYTLTADAEMSEAQRRELAPIYARRDWRALVRGGSGQWYAVSDKDSETAAADAVLQVCRAAEPDCTLRALGNFRVEEPR